MKDSDPEIKCDLRCVPFWANDYNYREGGKEQFIKLAEQVRIQGCLTEDDLKTVCEWKSPRFARNYKKKRRVVRERSNAIRSEHEVRQGCHRKFNNFGRCRDTNRIYHPSFLSRAGLPDSGLSSALVGFSY